MHKRLMIMLDEDVYDGLHRIVGRRGIGSFVSDVLRPHLSERSLDDGYRSMANDAEREAVAHEWLKALANDGVDAAW